MLIIQRPALQQLIPNRDGDKKQMFKGRLLLVTSLKLLSDLSALASDRDKVAVPDSARPLLDEIDSCV